eukprot:Blabericola_migrator_1__602@NODE_1147_length_5278_cov_121_056227_g781_i0_p5_GENE_NODE_1147_length_5278_cov_121_056227_g781_i0NODE_1147_length_5278_cov_121_056227_g781_i0_p5_ORF_typecomplete_len113_score9_17LSM/PF01423_22/2_9e17Hfq/PF17209_3/0_02DUF150_C/PF17384_2/0_095DUF150_C/PF17384_2/3e03_NODE_1147_length_5278_cov_121_056227_g781_i029483286
MSSTNKTVIRNDLTKHLNTRVVVKFLGGRQISGVLKGFDDIVNLVLDECKETMLSEPTGFFCIICLSDSRGEPTERLRNLGLVVVRGTGVVMICTEDGFEEIENPFVDQPII